MGDVAAFRGQHRAEHIGPRYTGWLHFATTTVVSLAAIAFAISRVRAPRPWELALVPSSSSSPTSASTSATAVRCTTAAAASP